MFFLKLISVFAAGVSAVSLPHSAALDQQQNTAASGNGTMAKPYYSATCTTPQLLIFGKSWVLQAACEQKDHAKTWRCTRLDLNQCYRDNNGALAESKGGQFIADCEYCRLGTSNLMFGCVCKEDRNKVTWVRLDDLIENDDGWMQCFDSNHRGTETC
ncbi:hypothetical protein F4779DRAFT_638182 [Xylariaceae sp. FL0662B]|nr:hypothetical protein F4779DRAFT_638182 [Xylariaceae sp. FL0662B]